MFQIIDPQGDVVGPEPDLSPKELIELYRLMVLSRHFDRRALALQRQGRLGTYAMLEGQEAAQVGSAYATAPQDFIYPSYREHGVQLTRGMPAEVILSYWRGLPNATWDPYEYGCQIIAVPIATHLPHAVGHAYTDRLQGKDTVTLSYFGDGATSENDFHSAMNLAGVWKAPTVFVCQNNLYAISVPYELQTASETIAEKAGAYGFEGIQVDGMDVLATYQATADAVEKARSGGGPTLVELMTYRYGAHGTADDARLYRTAEEEDEWREKDPISRFRTYLESKALWSDGLDEETAAEAVETVERAITNIEGRPLPTRDDIVRHSYHRIPQLLIDQLHDAQRALGEEETEFQPDETWAIAEEQTPTGPTKSWTMAEALNAALRQAMERDSSVVLLGEDVGIAGGVFRISEGLLDEFGAERVIDTPLNESGIVGAAIGMAAAGGRPIAEIQFDGFVYPAFDQIVSHLGRMRFRTRGHMELPVVVRFPNGPGIGAHEHHCDSPEAYFTHAPGLVVVVPSTPYDAKGMLAAALESSDPVIFCEPKVLYRAEREDVPVEHYTIPFGKARVRRDGTDVTLVTYGGMVPVSFRAAEQAAAEGISVEVIDLRTVYPWDTEAVLGSVQKTGRFLFAQEPQQTGG
ncbi:MAG: pyruvate dehydrogenase (acetyl-transferring) E1 component subunit alpha [Acidimicrobiia bacterium]